MIRLAFVGPLALAEQYELFLDRFPQASLDAVAHPDRRIAVQIAERLDASCWFTDWDALLDKRGDDLDAVLVFSDIARRGDDCRRAALAGKHILADAPVGLSCQAADEVTEACRASEVLLMVGNSARFLPSVLAVKASLDAGELGKPGLLRIHRWNCADESTDLVTQLLRDLDLANWFFAEPPSDVYAVATPSAAAEPQTARGNQATGQGGPTYVQVHLGFPSQGMALLDHAGSLPSQQQYYSLSLIGSRGAAYADDHPNRQLGFMASGPTALGISQEHHALRLQFSEFLHQVEARMEPGAADAPPAAEKEHDGERPGQSGRLALQVAEAVRESMMAARPAKWRKGTYELA